MPSPRRTRASPQRKTKKASPKRSPKRKGRLQKGSKEAKDHMARLRAMRKVHKHKLTKRGGGRKTVKAASPRRATRGGRKTARKSPKRTRKSPSRTRKATKK